MTGLDWVKNKLVFVCAKLPIAKALIKRYNISWASWFADLGRLVPDPGHGAQWAIFRNIDPVYIHNYVLGGIIANNMLQCVKRKYGFT